MELVSSYDAADIKHNSFARQSDTGNWELVMQNVRVSISEDERKAGNQYVLPEIIFYFDGCSQEEVVKLTGTNGLVVWFQRMWKKTAKESGLSTATALETWAAGIDVKYQVIDAPKTRGPKVVSAESVEKDAKKLSEDDFESALATMLKIAEERGIAVE
tara:strand:+ start:94 stop:570 length:477 start_codon:yes stop_codon:yes gene_type:complete